MARLRNTFPMNPPDLKDSFYPFLSVFVLFMILCIIVTEKCRNAQCYYGGDLICKDMHVVLPVPPCEMTFTPLGFLDAFSGAIWRFLIFNAVIDVRCGVDLTLHKIFFYFYFYYSIRKKISKLILIIISSLHWRLIASYHLFLCLN